MGAIFYQYSNDSMFTISANGAPAQAQFDFLSELVSKKYMAIVTQIGVQLNDSVQFFQTFDDFIHYYWFGKGLGSISFNGVLFTDCSSTEFPGLPQLMQKLGNRRGTICVCSMGKYTFSGVLTDLNMQIVSEPETHIQFTANFGMIDSTFPKPKITKPKC